MLVEAYGSHRRLILPLREKREPQNPNNINKSARRCTAGVKSRETRRRNPKPAARPPIGWRLALARLAVVPKAPVADDRDDRRSGGGGRDYSPKAFSIGRIFCVKAKQITEQDLSAAEIAFIKQHGIFIEEIIDVGGMIPIGQKRAMEAKGARLCITKRSCGKGHRLETRSNHCPVCAPKNLAFEKRHSEKAFVYVCRSGTGLVKIGYAADPQERNSKLNREAFASCSNWQLVFKIETEMEWAPRGGQDQATD